MKWVKLSNSNRALASTIAAVSANYETYKIMLKNDKGDFLCSVQHDNEEDFAKELARIDEQLG